MNKLIYPLLLQSMLAVSALVQAEQTVIRPLNLFEKAELLMDVGCSGNMNFTVIATYRGNLNTSILQKGMLYLQKMHPLLRAKVDHFHFVESTDVVPFTECVYEGPKQWRTIAKRELAKRFDPERELMWRVAHLKRENGGQILVTYHHAIADGICVLCNANDGPFRSHS